jgi:predicted alpha/beta hydrolase family esterase
MRIVYIHGANATSTSFNYIKTQVLQQSTVLNYSSTNGFVTNLEEMLSVVKKVRGPIFFVAHSLGGVYALHLSQHMPDKVAGAVTLSTPYSGSNEADIARMFLPNSQLLKDISPSNTIISSMSSMTVPANWSNIVTTRGSSPFINTANDGVVTSTSMKHLNGQMKLIEVDLDHYEVLQSSEVISIISSQLTKTDKKQ